MNSFKLINEFSFIIVTLSHIQKLEIRYRFTTICVNGLLISLVIKGLYSF